MPRPSAEATDPAGADAEHPIIVFDAICVLCSANARFVARHDRAGTFRMASMQSDAGQSLYRKFGFDPADPGTLILVVGDCVRTDSDAILAIWDGFGGAWRATRVLRLVPRVIRDVVYRWVAAHRYRLFGKREACWVPSAEDRWRFL